MRQIDAEIKRNSPQLSSLQDEVGSLQKQILDVGGPKLKRAQAKVDSISAELTALGESLTNKKVALGTAKKQAAKVI